MKRNSPASAKRYPTARVGSGGQDLESAVWQGDKLYFAIHWKIALFLAMAAFLIAGCGVKTVSGQSYVTSDGDTITFFSGGKATERNGNPGVLYPDQAVSFDAAGLPAGTGCTYTQNGEKLTLNCGERASIVFTINDDASLTGPPTGMFKHTSFAHLSQAGAR
jgi:hypothetical protein